MNKFRKLIALLLTVIMFVGVLPMNALAAVIVATDTSESKQISVLAIKPDPETPKVYYKTFVFHIGDNLLPSVTTYWSNPCISTLEQYM